jgi:hypothetical protein
MKTKLIGLVVATMACGQATTDDIGATQERLNGNTWTTIVDSTGLGYGASYVAASRNNTELFVGGYHFTSSNTGVAAWVFRRFDGTNWHNDDVYQYVSGHSANASGVAYDWTNAHLFVIGEVFNASDDEIVLVRTAPSVGSGFSNSLNVQLAHDEYVRAANVVQGSDGMYVFYNTSLDGVPSTTHMAWNDGSSSTWVTVTPPTGMRVTAMCTTSIGAVIAGTTGSGSSTDWVSYYTQDHATWHVVDTITHTATSYAEPTACGFNGQYMFIAGLLTDPQYHWLVRRGSNYTGGSWQTVDTETVATPDESPMGISAGGTAGKVFITGWWNSGSQNLGQQWYWRTRRGSTDGLTWVSSDEYQPTSSKGAKQSYASAIVEVPELGTFVVGEANGNAIVRKLN